MRIFILPITVHTFKSNCLFDLKEQINDHRGIDKIQLYFTKKLNFMGKKYYDFSNQNVHNLNVFSHQ